MSLSRATRSETTKLFSTSAWWIIAVIMVVCLGVVSAVGAGLLINAADSFEDPVPVDARNAVYAIGASFGYVFALVLGTLMVTSEYRHNSLTQTFLSTPRRGTALLGKVVVAMIMGLLYGVIAMAATVLPAMAVFAIGGQETGLSSPDTWAMFGRALIAMVLWALIGVGIGALVRNQTAAVVGVLAFTQFIEPIARISGAGSEVAARVTAFLPGSVTESFVGAGFLAVAGPASDAALGHLASGIVLAGYALVFLALGYLVSWRRDTD